MNGDFIAAVILFKSCNGKIFVDLIDAINRNNE